MSEEPVHKTLALKTITDIRLGYHYNLADDIIKLHNEYNSQLYIDPGVRAGAFYSILRELAKTQCAVPKSSVMVNVHQIIHVELLQTGFDRYKEAVLGFVSVFPNISSKLLLATPLVPETEYLLTEFNTPLTDFVEISYVSLNRLVALLGKSAFRFAPRIYNILDRAIAKRQTNILNFWEPLKSECLRDYTGVPEVHAIESAQVHENLNKRLDEFFKDFGICEKPAYTTDIAIVMRDGLPTDDMIRNTYVFWNYLKSRGYRLTLFHSRTGSSIQSFGGLFADSMYLGLFSTTLTQKILDHSRFRIAFYLDDSPWSRFLCRAGLGVTQIGMFDGDQLPDELLDYTIYTPKFHKDATPDSNRSWLNVQGVGFVTVTASVENPVPRSPNTKLVMCPWRPYQITAESVAILSRIAELKSVVYFFIIDNSETADFGIVEPLLAGLDFTLINTDNGRYRYTPAMNAAILFDMGNNPVIDALRNRSTTLLLPGSSRLGSSVMELCGYSGYVATTLSAADPAVDVFMQNFSSAEFDKDHDTTFSEHEKFVRQEFINVCEHLGLEDRTLPEYNVEPESPAETAAKKVADEAAADATAGDAAGSGEEDNVREM